MPSDFQALAGALAGSENGQRAMQMMGKVSGVLNSTEGRSLLNQLGGGGGDALKDAAASVGPSDPDAFIKLVNTLLSTKDGIALITMLITVLRGEH